MKNAIRLFFLLLILIQSTFSQLDDILKKVPGVGDIFLEESITTSIKDAYPQALWLEGLDKKISYDQGTGFNLNLGAGYYRYKFNTFCLHAGTYAPTEGSGYLVAPLKGPKAELIKNILGRYYEHPEIEQTDVQLLVWGIEAGQKFSNYDPSFQYRVTPLLKPEEIAMMEVEVKDIAYDLLPQEAKDVLDLYRNLRGKLSDVNASYEDIEKLAVKTGIAPLGKGSKNIDAGVWTSIGDGVYMRSFPEGYRKSQVEIYIPQVTKIEKNSGGFISAIDDGRNSIAVEYDASGVIKQVSLKNTATGEEQIIDNGTIDNSALKKSSDELVSLIKKSFGKKRSKNITSAVIKDISQLKAIESFVSSGTAVENAKQLTLNALNNYVSNLEAGNKKGGGKDHKTGLSNLTGLVFAPANTSQQRLGNGGPEGGTGNEGNNGNNGNEGNPPNSGDPNPNPPPDKEKECKVKVYLSQVNEQELPEPDWVYNVSVQIDIEGNDEECNAEEIMWTLFDVSKERGRYINDKEQYDNLEEDLQISDLNADYNITKTTASKQLSGKSQTQQINIVCKDYGAYGKLKVSVKVKGNWYEAEADGTPDKFITIPLDLNDNKISDSWEKQNSVFGKPADWDGDPNPAGQKRNGDGLTNYEEYRGCFIDDNQNDLKHIRLNPLNKEIFVVDPDFLFVSTSWESASGIKSYYLTPQQVYGDMAGGNEILSNKVNFCSGFDKAPAGIKHAIRIIKVTGVPNIPEDQLALGETINVVGTPKMVQHINIYFDVIKKWFGDVFVKGLEKLIKNNPNGYTINGKFYSKAKLQYFLDAVSDPAKLNQLVDKEINTTVIHECGHNCGVQHHEKGDPNCPMNWGERFNQNIDFRIYNVLELIDAGATDVIAIYTNLKFCKTGKKCWKQLDVNDN